MERREVENLKYLFFKKGQDSSLTKGPSHNKQLLLERTWEQYTRSEVNLSAIASLLVTSF